MSERLPERLGEAIRRDRPIRFRFERRTISAFEGDTVGSALAVAGVTITSRSFKYHRPRGLHCMTGSCPNCLMQIDGIPNVRACTEPVREGMRVERQNAWPSVDRDIHGWLNTVSFMMPPGFYYKIFQRPRWAWPFVEPFIRSKAGLGTVPHEPDHRRRRRINLHPDVLVIGAGAAGLAAAAEAAKAGATVVLLEQGREAGGHLLGDANVTLRSGLARQMIESGVRFLPNTAAFGVFGGRLVAAAGPDALYRIRAKHLIFATGAVEQSAVFPGNDLPGVMLSSGVELLLHRYRVLPGTRAVVLTAENAGYSSAWALKDAGAEVTVVDLRSEGGWPEGFPVVPGSTILSAQGRRRVTSVTVGSPGSTSGQKVACDLVAIASVQMPSTNLLAQAGAKVAFDDAMQVFLPVEMPERTYAVGAVAGSRTPGGRGGAGSTRRTRDRGGVGIRDRQRRGAGASGGSRGDRGPGHPPTRGLGRLREAVRVPLHGCHLEGAEDGGRRGVRFDGAPQALHHDHDGSLSGEVLHAVVPAAVRPGDRDGPSRRRCPRRHGRRGSPWRWARWPARRLTPRKQTTMHDRHATAGAEFMWAGDWRRPHHYTTPEAEVDAVRNRVGLIDVSTLGKFRIKGPQSVELLERLYPSRFSDLAVGRVRYGAMLNDEGVILDDGAVVRLADDEFFVTVTTGNTAALERWITWWNADWQLDARVLNVTGAFGAVNLAGPRARSVMAALTDADVSGDALPYMSATSMEVAGVPSLVLRIGFVGEMGYEIHFPSTVRRTPLGLDHGGGARRMGSRRSVSKPSGSCGSRSSTSSWVRTPMRSRIRSRSGSAGW